MNRQFLLLVLIFTLTNAAFSQDWVIQEANTSSSLKDVFFVNHNKGFVVGTYGTLLQTTNGGLDWSIISLNTTNHLSSIYFTDSLNGFLVSDYELYKSEDGGQTWISQDSINGRDIHFVDQDTGYVFGNQKILTTTDGGLNWSSLNPPNNPIHDGGTALDPQTIFVWGAYGTVYKSSDNGLSWQLPYASSTQDVYDIFFVNDSVGYLAGGDNYHGSNSGFLNKTINKGEDWSTIISAGVFRFRQLHSISFVNEQLGFMVGNEGNIAKTTDSGNTWTTLNSPTNQSLNKVFFLDSLIGYSVGANGTILKTINSGGYSNISTPTTKLQFNIYPNPFTSNITIQGKNVDNLNTQVYIYNLNGKIVYNTSSFQNSLVLDLEKLKPGIYIVNIFNDKNSVFSKICKL
ncbi:MAG: YCF48-related protein [Bacteroidales bacterium]|nr:YCF48-related protein [Bacteroidales bacterium]